MNRIIKFRAWDKVRKVMCDVWDISFAKCNGKERLYAEANEVNTGDNLLGVDTQIILMQFTGMLDKNGKEIYEGDVVKFPNMEKTIQEIKWEECGFNFGCDFDYIQLTEIIGNIYENPELLKQVDRTKVQEELFK